MEPLLGSNTHAFFIYRSDTRAATIAITIYFFAMAILAASFRWIALCLCLLAATALLGLATLHAFARIILDSQGIRKEKLYAIRTKCIPWSQMSVTSDQRGSYSVQSITGSQLTFSTKYRDFDPIIEIIHSHGIPITNAVTAIPIKLDPSKSIPYPERLPVKFLNFYSTPIFPHILVFFSLIIITTLLHNFAPKAFWITFLIIGLFMSMVMIYLLFMFVELKPDGLTVGSSFCTRTFYPWNDIGYLRFVKVQKAYSRGIPTAIVYLVLLRLHGKDGKMITEMQWYPAINDIVYVAVSRGIPVLGEAEVRPGSTAAMVQMHTKLQYNL